MVKQLKSYVHVTFDVLDKKFSKFNFFLRIPIAYNVIWLGWVGVRVNAMRWKKFAVSWEPSQRVTHSDTYTCNHPSIHLWNLSAITNKYFTSCAPFVLVTVVGRCSADFRFVGFIAAWWNTTDKEPGRQQQRQKHPAQRFEWHKILTAGLWDRAKRYFPFLLLFVPLQLYHILAVVLCL